MNKDGVLLQDERRAHYAANWIKANKMFQEVPLDHVYTTTVRST